MYKTNFHKKNAQNTKFKIWLQKEICKRREWTEL